MTHLVPELLERESLSEVNMGQEYFINAQNLENKVRELLPSQGGAGAGLDLSASTQIIPIIDLTESAEGSNVRADIQSAFSFDNVTTFSVNSATTTAIISNTGYYRVFGSTGLYAVTTTGFVLSDGASTKNLITFKTSNLSSGATAEQCITFDFLVKITAGDSLSATSSSGNAIIQGSTRQIASIDGTLV